MKSRASIKSHPLHPILVAFPIAFFIGALLFDALHLLAGNAGQNGFEQTAYYLNIAGVAGAVLAAIPGFIDFLYTVPPNSSAKKRAATHGLLNTTNLLLFVAVIFLKKGGNVGLPAIVAMEAAGVALLFIAGWMGGTLVYRNQIGVDPRYASAGKWKEAYLKPGESIAVAAAGELQLNQMKLVHIGGKRIVVARSEKGYVAFDDRCPHRGGSLAGGSMICGTVQCPWHGSQFDGASGAVVAGPAQAGIATYTVTEREGAVYLHLHGR